MSGQYLGTINQLAGSGFAPYADPAALAGTGCRPLEHLSEDRVREIVREELAKLLAERNQSSGGR